MGSFGWVPGRYHTLGSVTAENVEIGELLVVADITDRKLAEYAVRTAEQLAATGKLANAIAHESIIRWKR